MSEPSHTYDPNSYELKWLDFWHKGGWFHGQNESKAQAYTILIPPPNVTDRLHMGHGLNNTIQDILARFQRMKGKNVCWLPGTDHAGIATQMMVEKALASQGLERKKLGRDVFFKYCEEWKEKNGNIIIEQLKRLGASCDFSRQAYTMDAKLSYAVRKIFVDLFNDGLIYRGMRLVNWDPKLQTAISDDELENKEVQGQLWYIKYPLAQNPETFVTIATSRPETLLGDCAVAVNPEDERYKHLIGQYVKLPLVGKEIPIIGDEYVKTDFGSGCLKVTPAHDPNDFILGLRHKLPQINIFNLDATLNENCPEIYRGLERYEARKKIVSDLKELGLIEKIVTYTQVVPFSDRSKVAIEPLLSPQWFVKMKELAAPAIRAAYNDEIRFYPDSYKKTYLHWLENIQDWCISRQLWWGHQIPIWYCKSCGKENAALETPKACASCKSTELEQDEDVLDTWFSSWLWPLSPFGWPEETQDFKTFFPSQVLVTGADIIYLWVARMIMASYYATARLPFKDVYFNAIICDKQGRKFSKTLGNGIDPLSVIEKFGADAVRFTAINLAPIGGRVRMDESDFENGHRFMNKIWNAARFVKGYLKKDRKELSDFKLENLDLPSKWLLAELVNAAKEIDKLICQYRINEASEVLFHLFWRSYCDWSLEASKPGLEKEDNEELLSVLIYALDILCRLAAPFIPFIAEEIWQSLPAHPRLDKPKSLVCAAYPSDLPLLGEEVKINEDAKNWAVVQEAINHIRSLRTQAKVSPKEKLPVYLESATSIQILKDNESYIKLLAKASFCYFAQSCPEKNKLVATGPHVSVVLPLGDLFDVEAEKARLTAEQQRIIKIIAGIENKLANPQFASKAPKEVVEQAKAQLNNMQSQLKTITDSLNLLS